MFVRFWFVLIWCLYGYKQLFAMAFASQLSTVTNVTRPFYIVEFPEERDENGTIPMSIVSHRWIELDGDTYFCKWPSNLKNEQQRVRLLKEHVELTKNMQLCPVNIKHKSVTYEDAMRKLKRLEEFSSVSDTENENNERRRKRNLDNDFSYGVDSDTSEEYIPAIPKIKKKSEEAASSRQQSFCKTSDEQIRPALTTPSRSSNTSSLIKERTPSTLTTSSTSGMTGLSNDTLLKNISTKLEFLEKDVKFIIACLQRTNPESILVTSNVFTEKLPANTKEELIHFNDILQDDSVMASVSSHFLMIGGNDVVDATRKLLAKILTNQLALSYSWSGRVNKNKFADLASILKMIIGVVRKNPLARNATQSEIEKITKVWLRNAPDREGGRNRRNKII